MTAWKTGSCLALGLAASGLAFADADDSAWNVSTELTATYDDNLSRAMFDRDRVDDISGLASAALSWNHVFGALSAGSLEGFAEREVFDQVGSLNRTSYGGRAVFRWQRHLGFTAPFFQASASVQNDDIATDQRDSTLYVVQAFGTKRFTDVITASAGVEGRERDADDRVFDMGEARAFVNVDYALGSDWAVYGTYSYTHGDTFSSAQQSFCNGAPATDIYPLLAVAEEVESDTALNDALCGTWLVYRVNADTQVVSIGVNRAFGHALALDLNASWADAEAEYGVNYVRTLVRASLFARF